MNLYHHHWASGTDFHLVHLSTSQTAHSEGLHFWRTKTFLPPLTVWSLAFTGITLPTIWCLWQAGKVNCYFQVCFLSPRKEKPPDTWLTEHNVSVFWKLWNVSFGLYPWPRTPSIALHTCTHIFTPTCCPQQDLNMHCLQRSVSETESWAQSYPHPLRLMEKS